MKEIILTLLILASTILFSQTKKTKILFEKAKQYTQEKDFSNSIKTYLKAIEIDSTEYVLYLNIGINYMEIGEYKLAISNLKKAENLNSEDYKVYMSLGSAYSNDKEFDLALKTLKKAIILKESDRGIVFFNIGNNYMKWNKLDSAIVYFGKGLEFSPKSIMIRTNLAYVLILEKNFTEAKYQLEILIKEAPQIANNFNNLGFVLYKMND